MRHEQPTREPSEADLERILAAVERNHAQPFTEAQVEANLAGMASPDEAVRARAVRQVCPCRMRWELFQRCMEVVARLQKDPSPLVRAQALHVEEDSWRVQTMAERLERAREHRKAEAEAAKLPRGRA